ncbi:hypothetical protein NGF18_24700 [Bacillus tropicus]|nr:hypothetical protein [Bacillus tropicus]
MMDVIKLVCCHYKNNISKNCYKRTLTDLLQYYKDSNEKLFNAQKNLDDFVESIIPINNISAALLVNHKFTEFMMDTKEFYNNNNHKLSECKYDPKSCTTQFMDAINGIHDINTKFIELKGRYKQIDDLIANLYDYHKKQSTSKDIYCKFGIDGSGQLMCMLYNLNVNLTSSSTIYVFYGLKSSTRMFINYNPYRELYIMDFKSDISRQGYGAFVLTELPKIVQEINNRIKKNGYVSISPTDTITSIAGDISPDGTISQQDLINFYDKYGYISNNKLYKKV